MTPSTNSTSAFSRLWGKLSGDWYLLKEAPLSADEVRKVFSKSSLPIFHYYVLLVAATTISTFGLLTNSVATIIGGMLIAPLMNPLMALGYSTISFERSLVRRSLFGVVTGLVLVVTISYLLTALLGLRLVDSEILSRTHPNLLDLGVAIAAGSIGAFAYARPRIANAVPGVAIAVALVPPLCVVGIALASGSIVEEIAHSGGHGRPMAAGAFLLFSANVVGILFSAAVVFLIHGYGQIRKGIVGLGILVIGLCLVVWPLDYSFRSLYAKAAVYRGIEEIKLNSSTDFHSQIELISVDVAYFQDSYYLRADVVVPTDQLGNFQRKIREFSDLLTKKLKRPVFVEARAIPATFFRSSSGADAGTAATW